MAIETLARRADRVLSSATATVLVVDDDEVGREALAFLLRQEGFRADEAGNGWKALERLRAGDRPNLILLDMMMPSLDGWRLLETLRREKTLSCIPVIIVTAIGVASPAWAASLGAVACFRKPVAIEALLAEVRRWCGMSCEPARGNGQR